MPFRVARRRKASGAGRGAAPPPTPAQRDGLGALVAQRAQLKGPAAAVLTVGAEMDPGA